MTGVDAWRHIAALLTMCGGDDEVEAQQVAYIEGLSRDELAMVAYGLTVGLSTKLAQDGALEAYVVAVTDLGNRYELGGGLPDY